MKKKKTAWEELGLSRTTYFRRRLIIKVDKNSTEASFIKIIFLLKGHSPKDAKKILYSAIEYLK